MNQARVTIRRATAADLPLLGAFGARLARQHVTYDPRRFVLFEPVELEFAHFLEDQLGRDGAAVLVAEADGEVAGYLFARMEAESFEAALAGCAWIHDIFVAESARGLRIGARLVEAAAEWARALGSRALMLSVAPQNDAARALFGRHGFRVTMQEMRLDFEDKS